MASLRQENHSPEPQQLSIFTALTRNPYYGMTYYQAVKAGWRILDNKTLIIYQPNLVSRRVRIISA